MYRELTEREIKQLESQGCTSNDWSDVHVSINFMPFDIRNTHFDGPVRIGEGCRIDNVGVISTTPEASFGEGVVVPVLNEAGDGNVMMWSGLTSQMAALMIMCEHNDELSSSLFNMIKRSINEKCCKVSTIGNNVTLSHIRELTNVHIGDECEVIGASRLTDTTLSSNSGASIYVGDNVICENVIMQGGASVTDHARLYNTFVGEACHVGRGFTSENSVFFANSHMDNGESCAALCGPFTVSHHKSSLLIGGQYSFYNAGSGTNFSNHAYKMGPVHYGILERGSKTASGSHTLWPAKVGTFSMLMGKIQSHPDTRLLPFSYLIAHDDATYLIPGRNLTTVGTYRDIQKWPQRDARPHSCRLSLIHYDWLNPLVVSECISGMQELQNLKNACGENAASYQYNGTVIKNSSLHKGCHAYELAIKMFVNDTLSSHPLTLPSTTSGTDKWIDLLGMLAPENEVMHILDSVQRGELVDIEDVEDELSKIYSQYDEYKWAFAYRYILNHYQLDTLTQDDADRILSDCSSSRQEWIMAIRHDAEKEFALGDIDDKSFTSFLKKIN